MHKNEPENQAKTSPHVLMSKASSFNYNYKKDMETSVENLYVKHLKARNEQIVFLCLL